MIKGYDKFIKLATQEQTENPNDFLRLKKRISKELSLPLPTNADLREVYNKLIVKKEIVSNPLLERNLMSKKIRTQSGVAVVAVLTKPYPCPGKCIYCPSEKGMPKSYLSNEPAVMRAITARFSPHRQVQNRIRALELNGHNTDKIELIVMGGTFSYLPKTYQKKFITECFRAVNDYGRKNIKIKKHKNDLQKEQRRNEKAKRRIIGLTLETRPDYINDEEIKNFRGLGCTRVELGVQSIFDDILEFNKRGHLTDETIRATRLLKNAGFKINYHMMPGLPKSTPTKDFKMFRELFQNPDFQPDMLKIYPTVVVKNSALYDLWKKGNYKPLSDKVFEKLAVKIKNEAIPYYVRIARLVRDVPGTSIVAGPRVSNLRQIIIPQSKCPCIRCREVGADYKVKEQIILDRINYDASNGKEIFLQFVSLDKKKLFALLRLRIPNGDSTSTMEAEPPFSVLKNSAIIREVHTYGKLAKINEIDSTSPQHIGLGKKLIREAEKIAREEFSLNKIVIISGIGVRDYYRKLGYWLKNTYMVKYI